MQSQQIIIKVVPNETIRFPGVCTNCTLPATESMGLSKRHGRISRQVDVPLCQQCAAQLSRSSGAEERMQKLSRILAVAAALLLMVGTLLLFSGMMLWLRFLLASLLAVAAAAIVTWLFRIVINDAALPEKKGVLGSAKLKAFSWRTATFEFSNETFVTRFMELNDPSLLET